MKTSENINEISMALAKAQGLIQPASKDSENPFFKSKYADISAFREIIRKPMSDNGLAILQDVGVLDFIVTIITRIIHSSGQWIEFGPLSIPCGKRDAQGIGGAITYARRYALQTALCLVSDDIDDDANYAVGVSDSRSNQSRTKPVEQPKQELKKISF